MTIHNPVTLMGKDSNGNSEAITSNGGAASVNVKALGIEEFDNAGVVVQPIAGTPVSFVTVPAGCYTLDIRTCNTTSGGYTAFAGKAAIRINSGASISTSFIIQEGDAFRLGVNPGDAVSFIGATGVAGQIFVYKMG